MSIDTGKISPENQDLELGADLLTLDETQGLHDSEAVSLVKSILEEKLRWLEGVDENTPLQEKWRIIADEQIEALWYIRLRIKAFGQNTVPAGLATELSLMGHATLAAIGFAMSTEQDPGRRAEIARDCVWSAAEKGVGRTLLDSAASDQMIVVVPEQQAEPMVASEIIEPYAMLLFALDDEVEKGDIAVPIHALASATYDQQLAFCKTFIFANNAQMLFRNSEFFKDKERLVSDLIMDYETMVNSTTKDFVTELIHTGNVDAGAVAQGLLSKNISVQYIADFITHEDIPLDNQKDIFVELVTHRQDYEIDRISALVKGAVGAAELELVLQKENITGYLIQRCLECFTDLPAGTLERLIEAKSLNYINFELMQGVFDQNDLNAYFEHASQSEPKVGYNISEVIANPDIFSCVPRQDIVNIAIKKNAVFQLLEHIDKYTDGSDVALLQHILKHSHTSTGIALAFKQGKLPKISLSDLSELLSSEESGFDGLWELAPFMDKDQQGEILKKYSGSIKYLSGINKSLFSNFDKFEPRELVGLLKHYHYEALIAQFHREIYATGEYSMAEILALIADDDAALNEFAFEVQKIEDLSKEELEQVLQLLAANNKSHALAEMFINMAQKGVDVEPAYDVIKMNSYALSRLFHNIVKSSASVMDMQRIDDDVLALCSLYDIGQIYTDMTPEMQDAFFDRCFSQRDAEASNALIGASDYIEHKKIADYCLARNWQRPLIGLAAKIRGIINDPFWTANDEPQEVIVDYVPYEQALAKGMYAYLLAGHDEYRALGLPIKSEEELLSAIIVQDDMSSIAMLIDECGSKLPYNKELFDYLVSKNAIGMLYQKLTKFDRSYFNEELFKSFSVEYSALFIEIYRYSGLSIPWVEKAKQVYGEYCTSSILAYGMVDIMQASSIDDLNEKWKELGITQVGRDGVNQIPIVMAEIRGRLLEGEGDSSWLADLLADNPYAASYAKMLFRIETSEWGSRNDEEWSSIVQTLRLPKRPLPQGFVESDEVFIHNAGFEPGKKVTIDEDIKDVFNSLQSALAESLNIADEGSNHALAEQIRRLMYAKRVALEQKKRALQDSDSPAVKGIDIQVTKITQLLEKLDKSDLAESLFAEMSAIAALKIKQVEPLLVKLTLARAFALKDEALNGARMRLKAAELAQVQPSPDAISDLQKFLGHITDQEVASNYFTKQEDVTTFKKLTSLDSIRTFMQKLQSADRSGTSTVRFVPSRGLLLEASGHIGDACWASKYESIGEQFPDITAVSFIKYPGKKAERVVGSCLLIETQDLETGEDIVIIRGLNPIQNYVQSVNIEEFYTKFVDYVKKIAGGRRVAIVVDRNKISGQALTNRPALFDYIDSIVAQQRPIKVPKDTTFNNYELSSAHPVYYV